MGKSNSKRKENVNAYKINPQNENVNVDELIENINNFYKGMKIRQMDIKQIQDQIISMLTSKEIINYNTIAVFLKDKIYNIEYNQTSTDLIREAIEDAKNNYNLQVTITDIQKDHLVEKEVEQNTEDYKGIILPIFSILFLANSNQDDFIEIFEKINLSDNRRNIQQDDNLGYFLKGISITKAKKNADYIEKNKLENFLFYYLNLLTVLPMNLLVKNNEGIQMKNSYSQIMKKACEKERLKRFINDNFLGNDHDEFINILQFFTQNYSTLKNDNELRKRIVSNYVD